MQAPSQPRPSVLHALSVKIEPSSVGTRACAPAFIRPSAVTNRNSPNTKYTRRIAWGTRLTSVTAMSSSGSSTPAM